MDHPEDMRRKAWWTAVALDQLHPDAKSLNPIVDGLSGRLATN